MTETPAHSPAASATAIPLWPRILGAAGLLPQVAAVLAAAFGGPQLYYTALAIGYAYAVLIFSFVISYIIGTIIEKTMGFRVRNEDELAGIDLVMHGEESYDY